MTNLKYCMECGKPYDIDQPPCPNCGASLQPAMAGQHVEEAKSSSGDLTGWHPVPGHPQFERYWDGSAWAKGMRPTGSKAAPSNNPDSGLAVAGAVTALLIPIVGFIIGVILLAKSNMAGLWIMLGSIGASIFWYQLVLQNAGF